MLVEVKDLPAGDMALEVVNTTSMSPTLWKEVPGQ